MAIQNIGNVDKEKSKIPRWSLAVLVERYYTFFSLLFFLISTYELKTIKMTLPKAKSNEKTNKTN
jgi:hypothetical protein